MGVFHHFYEFLEKISTFHIYIYICVCTEKLKMFASKVSLMVTFKKNGNSKGCAEWYRNNLTKTSKKWSWTNIVGVYDCSSTPFFPYKPTYIFHVKPHLFKKLFRGNFLTNFAKMYAHKHKMCWKFFIIIF